MHRWWNHSGSRRIYKENATSKYHTFCLLGKPSRGRKESAPLLWCPARPWQYGHGTQFRLPEWALVQGNEEKRERRGSGMQTKPLASHIRLSAFQYNLKLGIWRKWWREISIWEQKGCQENCSLWIQAKPPANLNILVKVLLKDQMHDTARLVLVANRGLACMRSLMPRAASTGRPVFRS